MFSRPKIVYLAIKSRLLHVICRLLRNARGFAGAICDVTAQNQALVAICHLSQIQF